MGSSSKGLINLLRGWPNPALLPTNQVKAAAAAALSEPHVSTPGLLYGPDAGYEPLRQQIANWLTSFYELAHPIGSNRICITGGASQNLACILQVYSDPLYTSVWMVSPTYFMACRIFEDNGFHGRLHSVPEDNEGIDVEYLSQAMQGAEKEAKMRGNNNEQKIKPPHQSSKIYRHLVYAVPTFSNPSSTIMSLRRRQQLVFLARRHDALIVTDDVYDQLQWPKDSASTQPAATKAVMPRIVDIDRFLSDGSSQPDPEGFGNAVSNGSFSKIVGPGVRTGWAEGTTPFVYGLSQCGSSKSGGAASQLTATFMSKMLDSGDVQRHIVDILQPTYARRYYSLISAIEKYLVPLGIQLPQEDRQIMGGYFVWFTIPASLNANRIAIRAKEEENLIVAPGSMFAVKGNADSVGLDQKIRVCFAWEQEESLVKGIERLSVVISGMQAELDQEQTEYMSNPVHLPDNHFR